MKVRVNDNTENVITAIMIVSALVLVATLASLFIFKAPTSAAAKKDHNTKVMRTEQDTLIAQKDADKAEAENKPHLWNMSLQNVGPAALAKITALAKTHQVKLSSFRPQRTIDVDGLTQVPFLMTIDGSYPNVVGFVRDIESSDTKLAVSQAQMTSSDGGSDKVSASIGIVAYMNSTGESTNG